MLDLTGATPDVDAIATGLHPLFAAAVEPNTWVEAGDLQALGVPRRIAERLEQSSKRINSDEDARVLAMDAAFDIVAAIAEDRSLGHDPAKLAEAVPRP